MKKLIILLNSVILLGCQQIQSPASDQESPSKKALIVLLDGIPTDVLERVETPTLDAIANQGGFTPAYVGGQKGEYSETPTISAPGYMNMITGVWANKHNVWGNKVENPNYNYWNMFRIAKQAKTDCSIAIYSTWEDNRTKLIGEGKPDAGSLKFDYALDGFELDTINYPHRPDRKYIFEIDEHVSKGAAKHIKASGPDLSWVYLEFTDDMGHKFGDSPEMDEAVKQADNQVKRIWDAIQYREQNFKEDWMIVLTTDHGRTAVDGKGHGGQSERERSTWIITNNNKLNPRFSNRPPITDILPSVLEHLEILPQDDIRAEIDGISFIGKISLQDTQTKLENGLVKVSWESIDPTGTVSFYLAETNTFKEGIADDYQLLGETSVKNGQFEFNLPSNESMYKLLLKAPHNWTNTWIIQD